MNIALYNANYRVQPVTDAALATQTTLKKNSKLIWAWLGVPMLNDD